MSKQSVFECELNDADLIELIQTTIGQGTPDYIPVGGTLNLRDGELAEFLKTLGPRLGDISTSAWPGMRSTWISLGKTITTIPISRR